jgi:hypothetical protein
MYARRPASHGRERNTGPRGHWQPEDNMPAAAVAAAPPTTTAAIKVAAVVTVWSKNSHADVIVGKFLRGFPTDNGVVAPQVKVVSLYMDQVGPLDSRSANFAALDDLGTSLAAKYGVRVCGSIAEALCLGGDQCAVDGILAIGEHGDYPINGKRQRLYPRRHFWEQITGVLSTCPHRSQVPIFTDKHLAVTWEDAQYIYETGKELGLVHMAGSSVPHCFWRDPWLEHPNGSNVEAALMLSYGDLEACKHAFKSSPVCFSKCFILHAPSCVLCWTKSCARAFRWLPWAGSVGGHGGAESRWRVRHLRRASYER